METRHPLRIPGGVRYAGREPDEPPHPHRPWSGDRVPGRSTWSPGTPRRTPRPPPLRRRPPATSTPALRRRPASARPWSRPPPPRAGRGECEVRRGLAAPPALGAQSTTGAATGTATTPPADRRVREGLRASRCRPSPTTRSSRVLEPQVSRTISSSTRRIEGRPLPRRKVPSIHAAPISKVSRYAKITHSAGRRCESSTRDRPTASCAPPTCGYVTKVAIDQAILDALRSCLTPSVQDQAPGARSHTVSCHFTRHGREMPQAMTVRRGRARSAVPIDSSPSSSTSCASRQHGPPAPLPPSAWVRPKRQLRDARPSTAQGARARQASDPGPDRQGRRLAPRRAGARPEVQPHPAAKQACAFCG